MAAHLSARSCQRARRAGCAAGSGDRAASSGAPHREDQARACPASQAIAPADLPEAGHAGHARVSASLLPGEELHFPGQGRTRADQRHLPAQNVEQLRQLVDAEPAQESTDGGYSGVVLELEDAVPRARIRTAPQLGEVHLPEGPVGAAIAHRPELDMTNGCSCSPTRICRKSTGPGLVARTRAATRSMRGAKRMSPRSQARYREAVSRPASEAGEVWQQLHTDPSRQPARCHSRIATSKGRPPGAFSHCGSDG